MSNLRNPFKRFDLDTVLNLPEELKKQILELRHIEQNKILMALESLDNIGTLSEIIVQIYLKTGEVIKREQCLKEIYKLKRNGFIEKWNKKRGVYKIVGTKI